MLLPFLYPSDMILSFLPYLPIMFLQAPPCRVK
nr:MAG TPA: hypothetical protein [Caudoviricetes sp.]